ncbi:hypothetical protein DPMN_031156 [Dreissena polymorpha]|uniref:Secreted protein n=1 Tax=Dreissena polymorpha TaxID=45954 RepID=A0A9D4RH19_DREPO|nr:hypothetical protein DPMN_031156 [Dreissena polymorpha]
MTTQVHLGLAVLVAMQANAASAVLVARHAHEGASSRQSLLHVIHTKGLAVGGGAKRAELLRTFKLLSVRLRCLHAAVYQLSSGSATLDQSLQIVCSITAGFQVSPAGIPVPEGWATHGFVSGKLAEQLASFGKLPFFTCLSLIA